MKTSTLRVPDTVPCHPETERLTPYYSQKLRLKDEITQPTCSKGKDLKPRFSDCKVCATLPVSRSLRGGKDRVRLLHLPLTS